MKFLRLPPVLPFLFLSAFVVPATGKEPVMPGPPKGGDLHVEMLQARAYVRSMERSLEKIAETYPELSVETAMASANWKSSPFSAGCEAIEEDVVENSGGKGRAMLDELDKKMRVEVERVIKMGDVEQARQFLDIVNQRSKGEIEIDSVRATLLWQNPQFRKTPELEMRQGYVRKVRHAADTAWDIGFQVPMSWKVVESPQEELMVFKQNNGHGDLWISVTVLPTITRSGQTVPAADSFAAYNEDMLREEYRRMGIELTSFMKTEVNGMPALMFTRERPYEQLGRKGTNAGQVIRVYKGTYKVNFELYALGPDRGAVVELVKRGEPVFRAVGGSIKMAGP